MRNISVKLFFEAVVQEKMAYKICLYRALVAHLLG